MTAAAATAAVAVVAAPSPALAGDLFFSKSSGTQVSTTWLEVGELPPAADAPGNAHFGELWAEDLGNGRARVFGTVHDVQCEVGTAPYLPGGGGHGEPAPEDGPCRFLGVRLLDGGQVTLTIDEKLTTARLTGTLAVGSGHGESTGTPAVDITWTGVGATYTDRESGTTVDEYGTWTYRYDVTGRDAVVTRGSAIGPMVFDDEPGESSESTIGRYRSSDRQRS
ncbi:hypothetical protein JOD57_004704 [Geodermatophilus bullaregiensis]|uniref:hypothetical protein n=1 Tax=Geodermatophilus bullaregiensis TaxID=1564160 RepID=UPI001956BF69|nr:hypothetical protein [Geodermatophilus bullaregiensis]MBM7808867.1 hypothetical protein [Geodermatophilus bullaregiensis]